MQNNSNLPPLKLFQKQNFMVLLYFRGKGVLKSQWMLTGMTPEETLGQLLGLRKAWRMEEERLEASSSTSMLMV
jgi:hypothetical protein